MSYRRLDRRRVLQLSGTAVIAAVAGCAGGGDGGGAETTPAGNEVPDAIDAYLTAEPAADNYDGTIVDATGQDEVVVKVGAEGNGGAFAFAPPAVRLSAGATVSWQWTGEGGQHNVVSESESDFDFDSGDPKTSGDPFEQSFDATGIGRYLCEPHKSLGMKGAFEVV